ncbi:hypothetical protein GJW-30_1_04323 [Variibacter gotjawalensis]|uniref:Glycosyltransferase RgtA/B/C/D-like domain-containing protein n=1 Tax=Variibacter gotjawalensis TaxID=1333996 RepID=A0A0S3Q0R9_9BRAD|nr:hypothetical protein [Variibacter gotjawalensis]NIK47602.1 4-amino-4-deoxy-L-arabinose transferase-like glycosyltransferase [Variibacter gotjawalensis]RZS49499.1 hypothetical protein EV661_1933 [Variibacter gotjawalensis]BAT61762.1 hypothetical protein GJW-30_1_04323 [Variibacter gotjawalensis]
MAAEDMSQVLDQRVATPLSPRAVGATGAAAAFALICTAALLLRWRYGTDTDVSWIITINETLLRGGRLYVDVFEPNPPASVLIYMFPVWTAQLIGVRPELAVDFFVFALAGFSLALTMRLVRGTSILGDAEPVAFCLVGSAVFLILPTLTFGQREHIATLLLLPSLFVQARQAERSVAPFGWALLAGIASGIAVAVKPPLAAVVAAGGIAAAWRSGRLIGLFAIVNVAAAAVALLYVVAAWWFFPEFFTVILPMVADTYTWLREPLWLLILQPALPSLLVLVVIGLMIERGRWPAATVVLFAGAVGAAVSFLVQGKGWAYHAYPMLALALTALGILVLGSRLSSRRIGLAMAWALAVAIFGGIWLASDEAEPEIAVRAMLERVRPHPTMLLIGSNISTGHPLVRRLGGRWVGTLPCIWAAHGARLRRMFGGVSPEADRRLDDHIAREKAVLIADIRDKKPEVILFNHYAFDWYAWAKSDPVIAELLNDYEQATTIQGGTLWWRRR